MSTTEAASRHGGSLSQASARFGTPPEGWLDLSTGINPHPYPDCDVPPDAWARLPDSRDLDALLAAARSAYGIHAAAALCAAPGTQAILQALPDVVAAGRVAVLVPTYSEHAQVWRAAGRTVTEIGGLGRSGKAEVVVLTNPNNPDGRRIAPAALEAERARLAGAGGLLLVDEAFADVAPEVSMASAAEWDGLLVLRSFGKFFGLAGIRLGFAAGPPALIEALTARLGPWSVSGPAIEIGRRALSDRGWIAETRHRLGALRRRLDGVLAAAGLEIVGGTDLFRLAAHDDASALFDRLGRRGVYVRRFDDAPRWLRFGLPGDDAAFDRLERALAP